MKNKSVDREVALTNTFISQYGHAAQLYIDPETDAPAMSHVWGHFELRSVKAVDYATADVFRVDASQLLSEDVRQLLEEHYSAQGLDYKEEIQKVFMNSMQKLHVESQDRFEHVQNDKAARFQAGWADYGFYGGHARRDNSSRTNIHHEMYGDGSVEIKDKMICSEFVAKSIIASLIETGDVLKDTLEESGGLLLEGAAVFSLPFESERIERIHPERLIRKLQDVDCVTQVRASTYLDKLVDQDSLKKALVDKNIQTPAMKMYNELKELGNRDPELSKEEFVSACFESFAKFSEAEHLDIKIESPRVKFYLNKKFSDLHPRIRKEPNCILQFFKGLAEFFGFKPRAKDILSQAVSEIEQVDNLAIRDKYQDAPKGVSSFLAMGGLFGQNKKEDKPEEPENEQQPNIN